MRTAEQILQDVTAGALDADTVKIRETAHLRIVDVDTNTVEERTVVLAHTLTQTVHGLIIT